MDEAPDLDNETPRPNKRVRALESSLMSPPSPSNRSIEAGSEAPSDTTSAAESHRSGRASPIKQLQILAQDASHPMHFYSFDDYDDISDTSMDAPQDVTGMRTATQRLADGIGVLGYSDSSELQHEIDNVLLSVLDQERLRYVWANDLTSRSRLGSTPRLAAVAEIVAQARIFDRGSGSSEDEWNTDVQYPLLKLAQRGSKHGSKVHIVNVKTARIDPPSLAPGPLPSRVIDYALGLALDDPIRQAWDQLRPLSGAGGVKSWNHTTRPGTCNAPFAVHIETKSPMKSWTDGKPQVGLWCAAWLRRLSLLHGDFGRNIGETVDDWPAVPVLIAQGHDWHLLIVRKRGNAMTVWQKVDIGSTRSCFDALKLVAVLQWLMEWAELVWRPWFLRLIGAAPR